MSQNYVSRTSFKFGISPCSRNDNDSRTGSMQVPSHQARVIPATQPHSQMVESRNGDQPILHPVVQRRNTPLRVHHPRRVTHTFSVPAQHEADEQLNVEKTGRIPIPPPRGPRHKTTVVKNVSKNALRSPRLSPRLPRSSLQDPYVSEPAMKTTLVPRSNFPPRPADQRNGNDNSQRSKFYIDLPTIQSNVSVNQPSSSRRFYFNRVAPSDEDNNPNNRKSTSNNRPFVTSRDDPSCKTRVSPNFDELVDEIFKSIANEDTCNPENDASTENQDDHPIRHPNVAQGSLHRSKSDVYLKPRAVLRRYEQPLLPVPSAPAHLYASAAKSPDGYVVSRIPIDPKMEFFEEKTYVHYAPNDLRPGNPDRKLMRRVRNTFDNFRALLNTKPVYPTRKSSCPLPDEHAQDEEETTQQLCSSGAVYSFDEALARPVNHSENLDRTRKVTSADSGIADYGNIDANSNSPNPELRKPTWKRENNATHSSGSSGASSDFRQRRSRSQPPNRNIKTSLASHPVQQQPHKEEKTSDLDRSISARSSRTSELSEPSDCATASPPYFVESLWSQVKYEISSDSSSTPTSMKEGSLENMRVNVVMEILKNERDFVNNLKDVIEGYLYKCRQRSDMFSKGRIECIFGNIEALYEFQCEFLADLEANINSANPHASEIGHCFLLHRCGFSELYSDYCNSHSQSAAEIQQLKQLKQYAHFFEACRMLQDMVEISLDGFLLQPVQKICKYPLQLSELLKYTSKDHPDYQSVQLALDAMKGVTELINERKRRLECLEKIALWQETIEDWQGEDLVERSSQLIHYGDLNKLSKKNSWTHEYAFFLFDHQLIYCRRDMLKRNILYYKMRFDMDQVEVVDLDQGDTGIKYGWVIVCPDKEHSTILLAKNQDEKARWLKAFKDERKRVEDDSAQGFHIAAKDRLAAIQSAKALAAGKERKRSTTKDALKDLTDHTQLVQSMRSKSISMTLPVRIRVGQNGKGSRMPLPAQSS